jgi:hypothetical protein
MHRQVLDIGKFGWKQLNAGIEKNASMFRASGLACRN